MVKSKQTSEESEGVCPNCGNGEFHKEFHMCEQSLEVFCARCGFVLFG